MTQASVIRFLILGLPVGLIVSGVIAVKIYYRESLTPHTGFGHSRKAVNRTDLQSEVQALTRIGERHAGFPGRITATVKGLQSTLGGSNMGFKPSQQVYKAGGVDCLNLIVEIPARSPDRAGEIVIAGAHYDSAPGSPGADANASGVAACIALCQAFANTQQERTLRFVFFANGESPAIPAEETGSVAYARECKLRGEKVVAMLSLSSLGYYSTAKGSQKSPPGLTPPLPETGNFLAVFGRSTGKPLVDTFQSVMSRNSTLPVATAVLPDTVTLSLPGDDAAFTREGFPAVLITDTASLRNPNTHQPGDLPDTLDYERFTQAVQGIEGVLQTLSNPSRQ